MGERTSIADRRNKLQKRIASFHATGSVIMEIPDVDEPDVRPASFEEDELLDREDDGDVLGSDNDDEGSGEDEEEVVSGYDDDEEDIEVNEMPEQMQLRLPSALDRASIIRSGLESLASQELALRRGQANDALEALRLALGHKSLLWKTKVRMADTYKKRTRAWDDIKAARRKVEKHTRVYHRARRALINLGADAETMSMYKVIKSTDLRVSADIVDPSRLGQRNNSLPWFWRTGNQQQDQDDSWMEECEWPQ